MIKIADLLDRDFSRPVDEAVRVDDDDPESVFAELTEYIATDPIKAEYEGLFSAAAAPSPNEFFGVWISGFSGSGKSHFAKNLGYILANREVLGASARSLFALTRDGALLNQMVPCESFLLDTEVDVPARANAAQIAAAMYKRALRDLHYAEDNSMVGAWRTTRPSAGDWVKRLFDVCEICRPGKTLAFVLDGMGERFRELRAVVEEFAKESYGRRKAGQMPGPAWIIVTAEEQPPEAIQNLFKHRIDLSTAGIPEVAARRVLRKKQGQESVVRKLFRDHGAALIENVKLERCSRRTEFDEDQFVQFYPYLPHLIDLSIDIVAGIRRDPAAPKLPGCGNRSVVKQCFEMLVSDRTRLADQPIGALVSVDRIYELLEGNLPAKKQQDVFVMGARWEDQRNPGMAARVTRAICLMEFARTDLPRTTKNIAALLVQSVAEAPPAPEVAAILERLKKASLVREDEQGWTLCERDFDGLRDSADALEGLNSQIGNVNPRLPGWHNDLLQIVKKLLAVALAWYTRPLRVFNASVSRSINEIVGVLYGLVDLPVDVVALQKRLAEADRRSASMQEQIDLLREQVGALVSPRKTADSRFFTRTDLGSERTAYIVGLFGTGRQYVGGLMRENMGERAKYFRDAIRLHAGPTHMIYSGHATLKYTSRAQHLPAVTSGVFEAVRAGFANLIFVYRHPLDSLLTNWVWWRIYIREHTCIGGISQVYRNTEELCADLERNFPEFKAFADGDPAFFGDADRGRRFLSFNEFFEETELYLKATGALTLRMEDFAINPHKEFSKILDVMSVDADLGRLRVAPPRSKPYGYLAVKENVPAFRSFIDGVRLTTKRRMEKIGYEL